MRAARAGFFLCKVLVTARALPETGHLVHTLLQALTRMQNCGQGYGGAKTSKRLGVCLCKFPVSFEAAGARSSIRHIHTGPPHIGSVSSTMNTSQPTCLASGTRSGLIWLACKLHQWSRWRIVGCAMVSDPRCDAVQLSLREFVIV